MPFDPSRRAPAGTLALLLAASALSPLAAQSPHPGIDSIFSFAKAGTPGCAVAAIRNGAVLYARGYGMADLEHDVPITPETAFYLASVSKQFTAGAIHLLVLDGKLSLDDDVRKHVPEFPQYAGPITIRQLVNHTAGLRDYLELFSLAGLGDLPISNTDFLAMMGRQRGLNFPTGERFSYSNSNYVLLSIVVERVSGKSLRAFAEERIFKPLGMTATVFRDEHSMLIPRRALAYRSLGGRYAMSVPNFHVVGDGGLFSTVLDLARWEGNFWEPKVGGAGWLALSNARGKLNDGSLLSYGAGLIHGSYRGDSVVSHGGGYGGYNTFLLRFPKRRFSAAVLCNSGTQASGGLAQRVADLYLGDSLAPVTATAAAQNGASATAARDPAAFARFTGTFYNDETVLLRKVVVDSGKLFYRRTAGNRSAMEPLGNDRFQLAGTPIVAAYSARADTLRLEQPPDPPTVLLRVKDTGIPALGVYAGTYTSSDLGTSYTVTVRDSTLALKPERGGTEMMRPAFLDAFSNGFYLVRFLRDQQGKVVGMDLSAGERARHIRFERRP